MNQHDRALRTSRGPSPELALGPGDTPRVPPWLLENPFYVLELALDCSRAEVERAGQRLLAMLELGLAGAQTYPTPLGPQPRDPAKVRAAMAELRDPQRRLGHELWAITGAVGPAESSPAEIDLDESGFSAALSALGWR